MAKRALHPESLLHVPLVAQMLADTQIRLSGRALDKRWAYQGVLPASTTGFNPFRCEIFFAAESRFARWLKAPERSARPLNESDRLLQEVLFAVHDYLHCWAVLAIRELRPDLGFGSAKLNAGNAETFAFCHLLTEAAATVGLDYWYLSTVNLNDVCDIGTAMRGITSGYREGSLSEYRRFNAGLEVQTPAFFRQMAGFYCTGVLQGFTLRDLKRSPLLMRWLEHELRYGESQREYIRLWLSYLGTGTTRIPASRLSAPVEANERWKQQLIADLGELLWEKVKQGKLHRFGPRARPDAPWQSSTAIEPDFRFINANRVDVEELVRAEKEGLLPDEESFRFWFFQFAARHDYAAFDPELTSLFDAVIQKRSFALTRSLFGKSKRVAAPGAALAREPRDLLILS